LATAALIIALLGLLMVLMCVRGNGGVRQAGQTTPRMYSKIRHVRFTPKADIAGRQSVSAVRKADILRRSE
jgi:hypothetical protein